MYYIGFFLASLMDSIVILSSKSFDSFYKRFKHFYDWKRSHNQFQFDYSYRGK